MNNTIVLCAIPQEVEGLFYTEIFFSGVGKINAAATTEKIIQEHKPKLIINYGTAGSLDPSIKGLVKVTGFVDRDMDARPLGFDLGQTPFEDGVLIGKCGIVCGTGDTFATSTPEIGCDIVDMESFAIAKTCLKEGVTFKCFKYISDSTDENSANDWELNVRKGNELFKNLLIQNYGLS